jgi:hypothetical protein
MSRFCVFRLERHPRSSRDWPDIENTRLPGLWWLSPSIGYWSGQPGIAVSSHESLDGIADSSRFLLCDGWQKASQILQNHQTASVVAYDFERVTQNSEAVLNQAVPAHSLCRVLDRMPAHASLFLIFTAQNGTFKLYRVIAR